VASDTRHGPLIATLTSKGKLLAKQGRLSAGWTSEHSGVGSMAVASDLVRGLLIGVVPFAPDHDLGEMLAREGSLTARWHSEHIDVSQAAVASDPAHGPLIGVQTYFSDVLVKEGSLSARWNTEHASTTQVAVAG